MKFENLKIARYPYIRLKFYGKSRDNIMCVIDITARKIYFFPDVYRNDINIYVILFNFSCNTKKLERGRIFVIPGE